MQGYCRNECKTGERIELLQNNPFGMNARKVYSLFPQTKNNKPKVLVC